jgi:hypothetical protein
VVPLTKRDGGSVIAVDCESDPEEWVNIEVVSEEVLVLLEDSGSATVDLRSCCGSRRRELEGMVEPRIGSLENDFRVLGGGLTERSGWAATKALKLGSEGSGIFQGKRRRSMQRNMMARLHTSVFRGS